MSGISKEERERRAAEPGPDDAGRIAILERRLQNVRGIPSETIRLKDKTLVPRWFNSALIHDRFWQAQNMGWTGVRPDDVIDLKQIGNFGRSPDGWITRGERGQEVLMAMPKDYYDKIQLLKTKKNLEDMRDTKGTQAKALEAAAKQYGANFAEQMHSVTTKMELKDSYERVERTPGEDE